MNNDLAQQAITKSLKGEWEDAIRLNKQILKTDKENIDALNRLARAYAQKGKIKQAQNTSQKVLKIDPFNTIAQKSLDRWKNFKSPQNAKDKNLAGAHQNFLEESGKTTIVSLLNLGKTKLLVEIDTGERVRINPKARKGCITTEGGKYIGKLPDDLAARLKSLIKYGNEYEAYIKSAEEKEVKVFIKEVKRSKSLSDIPSFSSRDDMKYVAFTPPELVHDKSELSQYNEDNDE